MSTHHDGSGEWYAGEPQSWDTLEPVESARLPWQPPAVCGFCGGKPVGDAASWLDDVPRPAAPCPRCGVTTPRQQAPR